MAASGAHARPCQGTIFAQRDPSTDDPIEGDLCHAIAVRVEGRLAALGTQVFALLPGLGALDVYALTSLALLSALALPQVRTLTLAQPGSIPADKGSS